MDAIQIKSEFTGQDVDEEKGQPAQQEQPLSRNSKVRKPLWAKISFVLLGVIILACGGFFLYANDYYHPADGNNAYLASTEQVQVQESGSLITFGDSTAEAGLVFYPGAKVDPEAYAPIMERLARSGIFCVIVRMPFNLAFFDANAASGVLTEYPAVGRWYVSGHSLGGAMVSNWVAQQADKVEGVVFLASYPASDLSKKNLKALSLYGSQDEVLNQENYEKSLGSMPLGFEEVVVDGGNHAQFGNYGEQAGDGLATILPEKQWDAAAKNIESFIGVAPKTS